MGGGELRGGRGRGHTAAEDRVGCFRGGGGEADHEREPPGARDGVLIVHDRLQLLRAALQEALQALRVGRHLLQRRGRGFCDLGVPVLHAPGFT